MKSLIRHAFVLILISLLALTTLMWAQPAGKTLESIKMPSALLGRDLKYSIYLPADYESSARRYPVVYLLHGLWGGETDWIQMGEAHLIADRLIADGAIPPMIIVMPDGRNDWYVNDYLGKNRVEDALIQEFIPYIDAQYRTRPEKRYRALSGLSMGGWGSLLLSMRHPELFSACAALSAAVWTEDGIKTTDKEFYKKYLAPIFGPMENGGRGTSHFRQHHPIDLARTLPEENLKKVRWYLDCGDDDFLIAGNTLLHQLFAERKIPLELRVRDGGHTWLYWRTGIGPALQFIGENFR